MNAFCLKAFLPFLLLVVTLGGASAQALDEPELAGQDPLGPTVQAPNEVAKDTEDTTDESSDAVDLANSEETDPESKIEEKPPTEWKFYWHEGLHYWLQRKPSSVAIIAQGHSGSAGTIVFAVLPNGHPSGGFSTHSDSLSVGSVLSKLLDECKNVSSP